MKESFNVGFELIKIKNRLCYPDFDITINGSDLDWRIDNDDEIKRNRIHRDRVFVVKARLSSIEVEDDVAEGCLRFDFVDMSITQDYDCEINEYMCCVLLEEIIASIEMSKTAYIYKITNTINGMVYIGKTNGNPATRWTAHISGREKSKISKAIFEAGINNFDFKVVEVIAIPPNITTQKQMDELVVFYERKWIISEDSIKKGYNGRL